VVDGSRFYPLFPISLGTTSHRIAFNEIPNFQYLPKTARIFLVAEGTIEVDSFEAIPYIMSNFEFLQSLLKQWLQIDDFRAYSINIFYGPIIFGEFLTGILLQYTSITL
jgi:hypothetical protein